MSQPMPTSTYPLEKLLQLWRNEKLTIEQAIGHLLQHQVAQETETTALQKQVQSLQQAIKSLLQP